MTAIELRDAELGRLRELQDQFCRAVDMAADCKAMALEGRFVSYDGDFAGVSDRTLAELQRWSALLRSDPPAR